MPNNESNSQNPNRDQLESNNGAQCALDRLEVPDFMLYWGDGKRLGHVGCERCAVFVEVRYDFGGVVDYSTNDDSGWPISTTCLELAKANEHVAKWAKPSEQWKLLIIAVKTLGAFIAFKLNNVPLL
jgi:hypothetical protein